MTRIVLITLFVLVAGCGYIHKLQITTRPSAALTGNEFYHQAFAMKWAARDSFAVKEILAGNVPGFLKKFAAVNVSIVDSVTVPSF